MPVRRKTGPGRTARNGVFKAQGHSGTVLRSADNAERCHTLPRKASHCQVQSSSPVTPQELLQEHVDAVLAAVGRPLEGQQYPRRRGPHGLPHQGGLPLLDHQVAASIGGGLPCIFQGTTALREYHLARM